MGDEPEIGHPIDYGPQKWIHRCVSFAQKQQHPRRHSPEQHQADAPDKWKQKINNLIIIIKFFHIKAVKHQQPYGEEEIKIIHRRMDGYLCKNANHDVLLVDLENLGGIGIWKEWKRTREAVLQN